MRLLRTPRPNVVLVLLESFGRTVMDAEVGGEAVMPNMQRFRREGVWFENFFANSFRTDRGEVAVMNGFPAQTRMSVMKLPAKSRTLPSIARSLGREGYATSFAYGGDLNFTNQASYMYATGWQNLTWQKDLHFDAPTSKWGYADDVMTEWFADEVLRLSERGRPFLAGLLTLSSHEPFDVPYAKFDDKVLNAMAFADECVGRMIDRWKASPAWRDMLVILVADHSYPYPYGIAYNTVLRHRIPMIWLGGALAGGRSSWTSMLRRSIWRRRCWRRWASITPISRTARTSSTPRCRSSATIRSTTASAWWTPRARRSGIAPPPRRSKPRIPRCWTWAARCSRRPMPISETADEIACFRYCRTSDISVILQKLNGV